jgi:ArsR family transcriptional regulator, zinc-responsive transcriptional repressor
MGKSASASLKSAAPRPRPLLPLDHLRRIATCLRCVAHPYRLRIVEILLTGEYTVEQLAAHCGIPQPAASGHLRLMEGKGLLSSERRGRSVYYFVAEPRLRGILECVRETPVYGRADDAG